MLLIPNWVKEDEERIRQQALSEVKLMKINKIIKPETLSATQS